MKFLLQLGMLLVLVSAAAAQGPARSVAEIKQIQVVRQGRDLYVELTLSAATTPTVETAVNPDRLVLILPNTTADARQKRIPVGFSGVTAVRVGLNSANPPVTRVVVDLDSVHAYLLSTEGKKIALRVEGGTTAVADSKRSGPAPAASAPLMGSVFHRQPATEISDNSSSTAPPPVPPPAKLPPLNFPAGQSSAGSSSQSASAGKPVPSADHPKTGSLQQGTVFPEMGSPGTGVVPGASQSQVATNGAAAQTGTAQARPPLTITVVGGSPSEPAAKPSSGTPAVAVTIPAASAAPTPAAPTPTASAPAAAAPAASVPAATVPAATVSAGAVPGPSGTVQGTQIASGTEMQPATQPAAKPSPKPLTPAAVPASGASASSASIPAAVATATPPSPAAPTPVTKPNAPLTASAPTIPPAPVSPSVTQGPSQGATSAPAPAATATAAVATTAVPSTPAVSIAAGTAPAPAAPPATAAAPLPAVPGVASDAPAPAAGEGATAAAAEQPQPEIKASAVTPEPPIPAMSLRSAHPDFRTTFRVKYVAEGVAYLDGGRAAGLADGMKLTVRETPVGDIAIPADGSDPGAIAELEVTSVAETSAVTEIHAPKREVKAGDLAYLSVDDEQALVQKSALSATRKYPTVITFTEGDTLDDEARTEIPRPPMPSVNRARGRIGFDYMGTAFHGAGGGNSSNLGVVAQMDLTRIGGTYWNLSGFWRGRINTSAYTGVPTIQDQLYRTYHLAMTYDNPNSALVMGVGRMYLPWATSLDTIDGGYIGARLGHGSTVGVFAGSTPDPTSFSYNPDYRIAGAFLNFTGGSFDAFRYTSTSGLGVNTLGWTVERPFIFLENGIYYKRYLSIYDAMQLDNQVGNQYQQTTGPGVGRNFTTVRFMPWTWLEFDGNYNYFRDLPTFDPTLISTGLLDKYLYQGFNGGVRLEVYKQIWLYGSLGQGKRSGDASNSLNEMYGITFGRIPWIHLRADAHYSKFNSSFGSGYYESFSVDRNISDHLHLQVLGGQQNFSSSYTADGKSRFVTGTLETNLGRHYFIQGGFTLSRGGVQDYDQWMVSMGYRFDSKRVGSQ